MSPSVEVLENQFVLLRGSLTTLIAQGATDDQQNAVRTQIVRSRTNYWNTINSVFQEDDPAVCALVSQLNTEHLTLKATIDHLGDIAKVIDAITKAVDIGSQLAAKAASV